MKAGRYQKGVGLPAAMFVIVILAMTGYVGLRSVLRTEPAAVFR